VKINKLYIHSFGKLKDKTVDFSNGFNLIYGENEQGKTTLMEFIKMMFYGSKGRGNEICKNTRVKYKPWDNSIMSGKIYFEFQNKNYCLERVFGTSNATDTITLTDTDTGTIQKLSNKEVLGEKLFGLGFDAFEKTIFINNLLSFEDNNEADGEINSKLSNLTSTADENISFETVQNRITAAMDAIKTPKRRGGSIAKLENMLEELKATRNLIIEQNAKRDALNEEIAIKQASLDELQKSKKECFEQIKFAEKSEKVEKLQKFVEAAEQYEKIEAQLLDQKGNLITKEFLDSAREQIATLQTKEARLADKEKEVNIAVSAVASIENALKGGNKNDIAALKNSKISQTEALSNLQKRTADISIELYKLENQKKSSLSLPLLIIGVLLFAFGAFTALLLEAPIMWAVSGLAVILTVISFFAAPKKSTGEINTLKAELDQKEQKISDITKTITAIDEQLNALAVSEKTEQSLLETRRSEAIERQTALLGLKEEFLKSTNETLIFFSQFKPIKDIEEAKEAIGVAQRLFAELEKLRIEAQYAAAAANCKTLSEAKEKLSLIGRATPKTDKSLSELQEQLRLQNDAVNQLSLELTALKTQARTEFSSLKTISEINSEIDELTEEYNEQNEYFECLKLASEGLADAFGLMRRDFGSVIEERAIKLFSELTNQKYTDITVSKNFDMRLTGNDTLSSKEIDYLSRGAFDQAYFSLRLALSELMSQSDGSLPILLDDVFSQYDDKRLETAIKFLTSYAKENQVIFFTCHKQLEELSKQQNANIIKL